jgi:hypothetical protein
LSDVAQGGLIFQLDIRVCRAHAKGTGKFRRSFWCGGEVHLEPNPNSNRPYSKCYRALELNADSIGMRIVECGATGDCLFLVFAFFLDFEIPAYHTERHVLANSMTLEESMLGCIVDCKPGVFGEVLLLVTQGSCGRIGLGKNGVMTIRPPWESLITAQDGFTLFLFNAI